MQVFIVGTVEETAMALDRRRLNKQIIECQQILDAIDGTGKGWFNHPVVKMYTPYRKWLMIYMWYLQEYAQEKSDLLMMMHFNKFCKDNKPPFHTEEFFQQMKRRLYTKNNEHYKQWKDLGESEVNWYFVDGEWKYYKKGKLTQEKN